MNIICKCPFSYCEDISFIQFINPSQISYNCLRNHRISKEINEINKQQINEIIDDKNMNRYDICKKHNKNLIYFCNSCKINFCYECKDKHNRHQYISIIEKIPTQKICNDLESYIKGQKKELENIKNLFYELIKKGQEEFNKIFFILKNFISCEESILHFSRNNINHLNSIDNIKHIIDINFNENKYNEKIVTNLDKIKFNFEELKNTINGKSIFDQIANVFNYIENIYRLSNEKKDREQVIRKELNINYINIFKEKENKINLVNKYEYNEFQDKIKNLDFEISQYKILNEHEGEIRNIVSLNNGFFISSSLDGTFKIFNSLTGQCILSMSEPYGDQICQILKINPIKEDNNLDKTYILLLSRHLIFIRLNNNIFCNIEYKDNEINDINNDENNDLEILQSIDNNGIYISQGIQLSNSDIVAFNDNNELKIYKINPQTQTYLLHNFNINTKLIEFCALLEIKPNIFAASSNEHLDNGENILKIFDLNQQSNNEIIIKNLNCSTGRDSLCMIQKNKILAVGLQYFWKNNNGKNFVNGIAIVDVNFYQVIQIIEDFRVHSLCKINLYVYYSLINKDDIFKKEMCYSKKKILAVAGYDQEKEKRLIKFYEIKLEKDINENYKYIDIIKRNEIDSEHEGFINSIKWLNNGLLITCSSDRMIFLYKHNSLNI